MHLPLCSSAEWSKGSGSWWLSSKWWTNSCGTGGFRCRPGSFRPDWNRGQSWKCKYSKIHKNYKYIKNNHSNIWKKPLLILMILDAQKAHANHAQHIANAGEHQASQVDRFVLARVPGVGWEINKQLNLFNLKIFINYKCIFQTS